MLIPYGVDVPNDRRPFMNWLLCVLIIAVFLWESYAFDQMQKQQEKIRESQSTAQPNDEPGQDSTEAGVPVIENPIQPWMLNGWGIKGLIGHMWLHEDIWHLLGNLLFLWVAGNAICSKVGNWSYLLIYLICGFASAVTHNIFQGGPAIGASGAIAGIMGMFLVWYPENEVKCVWIWLIFLVIIRPTIVTFACSSYWLLLAWLALEVYYAATSLDMVGHFAHLGGFAAGVVIAVFMLERKWITMEYYEKSLLQLVGLHKKESFFDGDYLDPNFAYLQQQAQEAAATAPGSDVAPSLTADPPPPKAYEQPPPAPHQPVEAGTQQQTQALSPSASGQAEVQQEFIKLFCPCGKKVKFPIRYAGRTGSCPKCGKPIAIPQVGGNAPKESAIQSGAGDGMIRFSCKCGKKIKVPQKYSGKTGKCPQCGDRIVIP
jgi:membrane associated rhomboid family serine protease